MCVVCENVYNLLATDSVFPYTNEAEREEFYSFYNFPLEVLKNPPYILSAWVGYLNHTLEGKELLRVIEQRNGVRFFRVEDVSLSVGVPCSYILNTLNLHYGNHETLISDNERLKVFCRADMEFNLD